MGSHRLLQLVAYLLGGVIGLGLWILGIIYSVAQRIQAMFRNIEPPSPRHDAEIAVGDGEQIVLQNVTQTPAAPPGDYTQV
jgi:hypothetical protein